MMEMSPEYMGAFKTSYGLEPICSIAVPIPILNEEICRYAAVKDEDIWAQVVDYSDVYPQGKKGSLGEANYAQLKSGKITVSGKEIPTGGLSSYAKAVEIAKILKERIEKGKFLLSKPVAYLPGADSGYSFKPLKERAIE